MNKNIFYTTFFCGLLLLSHNANAGKDRLLLFAIDFLQKKSVSKSLPTAHGSTAHVSSSQKVFFSTKSNEQIPLENTLMNNKKINKKMQIVDVGRKNYKFDPKTSMYYYEDQGNKELKNLKTPEMTDFDTFVQFDVKKK